MELQALLVLCGVAVAGAAVLLLMGLFSSSGTSYEEAVAQQRRATTELLALAEGKNKPKKNVKKANKKLAKKERRTEPAAGAGAGSEAESEPPGESGAESEPPALVPAAAAPAPAPVKPHVEFSAAVVVGVPAAAQPGVKVRKRKHKVRPILINKEEPPCLSDPSAPPTPAASNHFEEIHPKDEFELMHASLSHASLSMEKLEKASEKKEEAVEKRGKQARGKQAKQSPEPPAKEDAKDKQNGDAQPKEQRKAKRSADKKPQPDEVTDPREEAVPPLNQPQPGELTTEKLLKQALASTVAQQPLPPPPPPAKKKGRKQDNMLSLMAGDAGGVSVSDLVRLVSEAPLSRTELQILTDALLNKHHGPLPEHSEWTEGPNDPTQKLKKQLADKEKALADEVEASQALHAKVKELRASLNAERSRVTAGARAAEEAAAERHTLQARLHRLTEEHMLLQSKLSAEAEVQAQRVQMEMHIQRLSESETALVAQLQALQAELNARALDAGAARMDAGRAQQHAADLAQQLQEANRMCAELDAQRQNAILSEQAAQQELRLAQDRLGAFAELQAEAARAAARAQQAEAALDNIKGDLERQKQLAQQASSELSSLKEQLSAQESELAELRALRAAPAQNGLPPADQHKAAELSKVEGVIESLRAELAAAQRGAQQHKEQLAKLQKQINTYQDKNNEAVTKAQEAQYNEVAAVLKSVCPSVAPSSAPSRAWLDAFAAGLKRELQAHSTEVEGNRAAVTSQDEPRVVELRAQNEHLQALVDKYKRIIDDTEGVLSRLQSNVTAEEARWARQLADKQRELDDVRARTLTQEPLAFAYSCIEKTLPSIISEMQNKIDSLQAELRQSQAANHNHSFADAERHTEERLLAAGLSEKHILDSCNGPLQVGLDEK